MPRGAALANGRTSESSTSITAVTSPVVPALADDWSAFAAGEQFGDKRNSIGE